MHFLPPEWRDRLPSTNTALLERLKNGEHLPPGFVLAAREQTAGRGRQGRRWEAAAGQNLTFSFVLQAPADPLHLLSLPMATALGIAAALDHHGMQAQTRWPNDLQVTERKICGILAERHTRFLVVGIGLNVNMEAPEAAAIDRPATSMRLETGRTFAVDQVLEQVLDVMPAWLDRWSSDGFAALRQEWIDRCPTLGKPIVVRDGRQPRRGLLEGFGPAGQLLLRTPDDAVREIWSADLDP